MAPDIFGRYKVYHARPPTIPDANAPMAHVPPMSNSSCASGSPRPISDIITPCPNITVFYALRYHWLSSNSKSISDREYLCNKVLLQPDFNPRDLIGVNLKQVDSQLTAAARSWDPTCPPTEGWKNVPLQLQVPTPHAVWTCATKSQPGIELRDDYINVSGYWACSLTDLMKKTFTSNDPNTFHYEPFKRRWKPPNSSGPTQTLAGEMYTSPAMIKAHHKVQNLDIPCELPQCVAGFMFASDGMQFASFSHVKGWPILFSFTNLPNEVKEHIKDMHGKVPTKALLTHVQRELMHAVWVVLVDNEFIEAWRGALSNDTQQWCLFMSICFVQRASASQMGTLTDMRTCKKWRIDNEKRQGKVERARHIIYDQGKPIQGKDVEDLLKAESHIPTMNAFSDRLHDFKFDIFSALVVDQLHEVELGVWKSLFKHLI
ncbi:hypothetical protein FRC10_003180 [Ceratobasidium sp. 414]|nr:hypothetical protein FRC10_003180 [Ceratobasidium sp. 414]